MRFRCPFCVDRTGSLGKRPYASHFSIDESTGQYRCFRCNASGTVNQWLASKLGFDLSTITVRIEERQVAKKELLPVLSICPLYPDSSRIEQSFVLGKYVRYLRRRGLTDAMISHFEIGVVEDGPAQLWGSISFPIRDGNRSGHIMKSLKTNSYYAHGVPPDALYNADETVDDYTVYVVEGVFDAIRLHPAVAIATLGKDVTDRRIDRLCALPNDLVISLDGDAWETSQALCQRLRLRGKRNVKWLKLPAGKDPADLGRIEVESLQTH